MTLRSKSLFCYSTYKALSNYGVDFEILSLSMSLNLHPKAWHSGTRRGRSCANHNFVQLSSRLPIDNVNAHAHARRHLDLDTGLFLWVNAHAKMA